MNAPKISRPKFPPGYVEAPDEILSWSEVEQRLRDALHYWIASVNARQGPHVVPRWGVWLRGRFYYDGSPQTQHALNIGRNPRVALHLESGAEAIILYGQAQAAAQPEKDLAWELSQEFGRKYEKLGYAPKPDQWDQGGLFVIQARKVLAWNNFMKNPTRFIFAEDEPLSSR